MKLTDNFKKFQKDLWNDKRFQIACAAVVVFCFIAHAYGYFNATIIHDRREFFMEPILNSAKRAKWMAQYFDLLTSFAYVPWLSGVLSIIFLAVSVYLIVIILDIKKRLNIVLTALICVTNFSVLGAHFFWPHEILAALPLACISAWFWLKEEWPLPVRMLGESLFVGLSLATYGAYTSVGATLVLLVCITKLFDGKEWKCILKRGMEYIVSFLVGMAFYYIVQRLFVYIQGIEILEYMGEDKLMTGVSVTEIIRLIITAYVSTIKYYLGSYQNLPTLMPSSWAKMFLLFGSVLFVYLVVKKWENIRAAGAKILLLLLIAAAPLSAGTIYVLSFGNVHFLMVFTYVLFYIYILKLTEMSNECISLHSKERYMKIFQGLVLCLTFLWGYRSIMVCNMAYMRLENNYTASQSIATRLLDRIETVEGFQGSERIAFAGSLSESEYFLGDRNETAYYLEYFNNMGPADKSVVNSFSFDDVMYDFLEYVLDSNLALEKYEPTQFTDEENKLIAEMNAFPAADCVRKMEDVIVVKLSD